MTEQKSTRLQAPPGWMAWSIWGLAAAFYLTAFYLRAAPAVMTAELMRDFGIGAGQLGNLSAFYFYAYVVMQIPIGVLTDTLGARKLLVIGSLTAAAGTFLFGATDNFALACVGRAVVGGSTAVGWLVLLRLTTHWFPANRFAMLSGLGLFFGNIGALVAQVPLRILIEHFSWRTVVILSAGLVLAVGAAALVFLRNDPSERGYESFAPKDLRNMPKASLADILIGFKKIAGTRNPWLILFAQGGLVGPMMTFTGLWGPPFLRARFGLAPTEAATICSIMIVCWAACCPLAGALSDKMGRRKPVYLGGTILTGLGWATMFYVDALPVAAFTAVAALTSVATAAVIVAFPYARESAPLRYMGTVTASTNMGNMFGPSLLQPGIGLLLDRNWTGATLSGASGKGAHIYGVEAYHIGFLLILAWSVVSCLLIAMTKETYCRQSE